MKIKERPGDFRVEELADLPLIPQGEHTVYRVSKERRNTLDVVADLAKALGIERTTVGFGGLKDYEARTVQFVTVPRGAVRDLSFQGCKVRCLGRTAEPMSSRRIRANRFSIILRHLKSGEPGSLRTAVKAIREHGFPNYFGDQRFGSVRGGREFPFRALLEDRAEDFLRLLFASPSRHDTPGRRRRGRRISSRWGRWGVCLRSSVTRPERAVFQHLAHRPRDFKGALQRLDRNFLLLLAFSYQSFLFNEIASRRIHETAHPHANLLPYRCGRLSFPARDGLAALGTLKGLDGPLPGADPSPLEGRMGRLLTQVLHNEGLSLEDLGRPVVKSVQLRWEERPLVVVPEEIKMSDPREDVLNPGTESVMLTLTLPRNTYATIVLLMLRALTGIERDAV